MTGTGGIIRVTRARLDEAVAVLASAFSDYPVFTFVLPPGTPDRHEKLASLLHFYAMSRLARDWPLLAMEQDGRFIAIVAANPARRGPAPAELLAEEQRLVDVLGAAAEARRRHYEAESDAGEPNVPHFFIGMIGVHPGARGNGYAKALMERIHALSLDDADSRGVALSTESESNLPFYERLGYRVTAEADVGAIHSWSLWRPDDDG